MALAIKDVPVPLRQDADGVIRVAKTRVTLDTVVAVFENGATAEEIAQKYPTLSLSDVYLVIAYYLRVRPEVDEYLRVRREFSSGVLEENERRFPRAGVRERLLARQRAQP